MLTSTKIGINQQTQYKILVHIPRVLGWGIPFRNVWQFLSPRLCKLSDRLFKFYHVCLSSATIVFEPEALKSLYRSPGYKKNQLVLCKNSKFVKDLPMIDAQFRFNQCNSFREEYISVFSPYGPVLILWPVVAAILDFRSA